ncbi:MAG TPA: WXG100 family type VII secretion target [Actinomycetota bacterium]|nr:WXG100 family type VII secretion target [Actinomycetota bacterium]
MAERITVTSGELRDTAGDMRAAAGSIQDELNRMLSRVQALTSSWTGQAATSFDGFYQQMNQGWAQLKEGMEGVSQMLDTSAQSYDETEAGIAGQFSG